MPGSLEGWVLGLALNSPGLSFLVCTRGSPLWIAFIFHSPQPRRQQVKSPSLISSSVPPTHRILSRPLPLLPHPSSDPRHLLSRPLSPDPDSSEHSSTPPHSTTSWIPHCLHDHGWAPGLGVGGLPSLAPAQPSSVTLRVQPAPNHSGLLGMGSPEAVPRMAGRSLRDQSPAGRTLGQWGG